MKDALGYAALYTILLLGLPARAEAYLDPTTGSIVLQVIIGGVLAALAATKLYWNRLKLLFRKKPER